MFSNKNHVFLRPASSSIAVVLTAAFLAALLSGCYFFPKEEEVLAPPIKVPDEISYNTVEVKRGTIENVVRCTGTFVSVSQKDLYFEKGDRLKEIYVNQGDKVKKGELLAELDTESMATDIQLEEIALKRAQIMYEDAKTRYEIEGGSRKELDLAELDLESEQIKLDRLKAELQRSKLVSPIDGVVVYVSNTKQGEYVNAYQTIVRVADPDKVQLMYSDDKVSSFKLGMKATVQINDKEYEAEVVMTPTEAPADADAQTKNSVQLKITGLDQKVKLGQTAAIILTLEKKENVIVIPKNLITNFGGRRFVHVLNNGVREERDIEVGIQSSTDVEVVKGLKEGELLISD